MRQQKHASHTDRAPRIVARWLCALTAGLAIGSVQAQATIELQGPMAYLFGIGTNQNHGYMTALCGFRAATQSTSRCGTKEPYGAWVDGPMNPYKYGGQTYFQIPHSEHYRIRVPNHDWGNRLSWTMEPASASPAGSGASTTPVQRDQLEAVYHNRNWLYTVYNNGSKLFGLTHHEWYRSALTIKGIPGFDQRDAQGAYLPWIATIGWASSSNGGASWAMKPLTDYSRRMIVVPEPSGTGYPDATYGFMHPSNIVKESNYYYVFTSNENYKRSSGGVLSKRRGVTLFRTTNLSLSTGWEFWDGSGWTAVNHNTYQGNEGPQQPYIFWQSDTQCSHLYAMNVRKHVGSGKWVTLGSKYCLPLEPNGSFRYQAVFSWTASLSNPTDLEGHLGEVQQYGQSLLSNNYYSFFDANGATYVGDNYENIGDTPLLVVTKDGVEYYHQYLRLSGF